MKKFRIVKRIKGEKTWFELQVKCLIFWLEVYSAESLQRIEETMDWAIKQQNELSLPTKTEVIKYL